MSDNTVNFSERKAMLASLCREAGVQFASEINPDEASPLRTHIPAIDNLAGGFPKNTLSEVIEPKSSSGGTFLIHRLLQEVRLARGYAALVDGSDSFSPDSISNPATLDHLYWVRCRDSEETIRISDLIAGDGNFSLLLVDLRLNSANAVQQIPSNRWYRLQRTVKKTNCTCIALTPTPLVSAAKLRFRLYCQWDVSALEQSQTFLQEQLQIETLSETRIERIG